MLLLAATNQLLVSRVAELEADLVRARSGEEEVGAVEATTEAEWEAEEEARAAARARDAAATAAALLPPTS